MTPDTNQPRPITASDQPVFPCWLWHDSNKWWTHYAEPPLIDEAHLGAWFSHWLPDQPTAPTGRPNETTGGELKPLPGCTFGAPVVPAPLPEGVREAVLNVIYFRNKRTAGEPQSDRAAHQFEIEEADEICTALAPFLARGETVKAGEEWAKEAADPHPAMIQHLNRPLRDGEGANTSECAYWDKGFRAGWHASFAHHAPTPSAESDTAIVEWATKHVAAYYLVVGRNEDGNVTRYIPQYLSRSALLAAMKGEQGEGKL